MFNTVIEFSNNNYSLWSGCISAHGLDLLVMFKLYEDAVIYDDMGYSI